MEKQVRNKKSSQPTQESNKAEPSKDSGAETGGSVEIIASEDIETLRKKLEDKEREARENYDRFLRAAADLENYKKRAAREKEEYLKFAQEELIKSLLPVIDNLERAVDHSEKATDIQSLVDGIRLTIQQLFQSLNKFGLSPIESVGKPFDPAVHEAVMVVETDQYEPNHVVEEFQKGYLLHGRLLRPAGVSVAKRTREESTMTN